MATNIPGTVTGNPRISVRLVSRPTQPLRLAAIAALRCTHADRFDRLCDLASEDPGKIVERVTASGHGSVLEHACFTFSVEGISRVTSHQLVRHRLASYSQQSQRYTPLDDHRLILPPTVMQSIDGNPAIRDALDALDLATSRVIAMLGLAGVPDEDIRYLLPQGTSTALVVTMNLRELSHFCGLRRCNRAQWEIRELAVKMAKEVLSYEPQLASFLDSQCARLGYCPEGRRSCGNFATLREIMNYATKGKLAECQSIFNKNYKEAEETAATKARILAYARAGRDAEDIGEGEE